MYRLHGIHQGPLDVQTLLRAYAVGIFPMGEPGGRIGWYSAVRRGILPLDAFHISGTLKQRIRQNRFEVRIDTTFADTIRACAAAHRHEGVWISPKMIAAYIDLHHAGHAHSVEAWQDGHLVGGLYGVSLGGAFFGESMFARAPDASKVALAALVERLSDRGYELLDTQVVTEHMKQFGCIEIAPRDYLKLLGAAILKPCSFV